jgi:hypothetical protein
MKWMLYYEVVSCTPNTTSGVSRCQWFSIIVYKNRKAAKVGQRRKRRERGKHFLKLILKYKENKIRKTGGEKKKEEAPSCTRNQTQNLQEESVPLLLVF